MAWQDVVREEAGGVGGTVTSGYRSAGEQEALHGSPSSFHRQGTRAYPGAIDVGGTAEQLTELFRKLREMFKGRIEELYLHLPAGGSVAIKDNRYLGTDPEAGRPQHLHIAINGGDRGMARITPDIVAAGNYASGESSECVRSICPPNLKGAINKVLGQPVAPQTNCICWSDVWMYGAALGLVLGGGWMVFLSRGRE